MKLAKTAVLGVASSLLSGACLFLVFRLGIEHAGASQLGSWALIQTAFVLARLPEAGVGINITRVVAVRRGSGNGPGPLKYLFAGLILTVLPVALLGILLVEPISWMMRVHFESTLGVREIYVLIFLSLATAILNALATVSLSITEGLGGLGKRHWATILSNGALACTSIPLVQMYGILGVGISYTIGSAVLCLSAVLLIGLSRAPRGREVSVKEVISLLWRQNVTISAIALVRLSFEPWTKFLVASSSGGLVAAAYVDLAFRVTTQFRVAVQAASQPLLTAGARNPGEVVGAATETFARAHEFVTKLNLSAISVQVLGGPLISVLALSQLNESFLVFFVTLVIGNSLNSLGVVGYYYDASAGHLNRLVHIHLMMMGSNFVLGLLGSFTLGATGAVAAYALSFACGGFALSRSWMDASAGSWASILRAEGRSMILALAAVVCTVIVVVSRGTVSEVFLAVGCAFLGLALATCFAVNYWVARMRARMQ